MDPVTLEVLWNRLLSVANEQQNALMRTAFSTIVRESQDLACAAFDTWLYDRAVAHRHTGAYQPDGDGCQAFSGRISGAHAATGRCADQQRSLADGWADQ